MLRKLPTRFIVFVLSTVLCLAGPNPVRAESTAKKIRHKLHRLEKATGEALRITAGVALVGAAFCAAAILDVDDDSIGSGNQSGDFRTRHAPPPPPHSPR